MEIINQLEEMERTGKKEHVVFQVTQWPICAARSREVSCKTGPLPRTQSLQPLTHRRNAFIWIKEVSSISTGESEDLLGTKKATINMTIVIILNFLICPICVCSLFIKRGPVSVPPCTGVTGRQLEGWFTLGKVKTYTPTMS